MRLIFAKCMLLFLAIGVVAQQETNTMSAARSDDVTLAHTNRILEPASLPSSATVDSFMRQMYGWMPDFKWKVLHIGPSEAAGITEVLVQTTTGKGLDYAKFFITPDGEHAINYGEMIPFGANPFAKTRAELDARQNGPARGAKNPSLTIVEFGDLQCPGCKLAFPVIDRLLADNPEARLVFQNFPLPAHDWAMTAALWDDCVSRLSPEAAWKFMASVYETQEHISQENAAWKLSELSTAAGANASDVARCATQPETRSRVEDSIKLGKDVGVTGTPTLFLNGRLTIDISGMPYEQLNSITHFQAQQK